MGEGNVAVMSLPRMEGLLPLQRRIFRPRCLFGNPDPLYLKDAVNQISQENKQRWNFDFENEQPMPGRYKWQVVRGADNRGSEKEGNAPKKDAESALEKDVEYATKKHLKNAPESDLKNSPVHDTENSTENSLAKCVENAPKKVQTRITDFMRKRKSSSNQKEERVSEMPPPKVPRRSSS